MSSSIFEVTLLHSEVSFQNTTDELIKFSELNSSDLNFKVCGYKEKGLLPKFSCVFIERIFI